MIARFISTMAKQVYDNKKFTAIRLPTIVKPIHYDISLKPNFNNFTFLGEVKIQFSSTEATKNIVLHANEIEITEGSLHNESKQSDSPGSPLETVYYSKDTETATLEFKENVASSGMLHLKFNGTLNDKMKGFYRTAFKIGESTVYAASTQFEATDARRCFPCWDEPAVKATFSSTLIIEQFMNVDGKQYERLALSNMNEIDRVVKDKEVEVKFAKTPIMSTYLLAFIIGPFEAIEGTDGRRPIRVFTTPGKKEQGRFALEVACKSLPYYEDYFGIDYPLPKMDLIAIPDFASGAMENWGLVTYREVCLLVDPENTSTDRRQYIAIVVAHELAHQWFGNLVTMEWWTHLWLNEGFASFMEYLCTDHIFPEYDIWSQFVTDAYIRALDLDSLHNSHPIEVPVNHPSEVDEIFDDISYNKGASVIRMLYEYIGDDAFRKGMKDYLTKFAYKNATTEDLWDCLGAASNRPVRRLMSGWTGQKGFPWLSMTYSAQGDQAKLEVTQSKFTADGKVLPEDADSNWMIPISAVTGKNPTQSDTICLLEGKSSVLTIEGVGDSWMKLNPGTIGLYRSAYPEEMMAKLRPAIEDKSLPPLDRLGIQSDYFALCQAGKVSTVELLKLVQAYKGETEYTVWNSINSSIGRLNIILLHTQFQDKFHKFSRDLFSQIFEKLTWSPKAGEKHVDAMTRSLVLNRLIASNDLTVINEARRRYKAHLKKEEVIPADLRGAVYRAVSTHGDDEEFESLFEIYRTSELHEEKNRASRALGFAKTKERLDKVINFVTSDEVRIQDKIFVIMPMGLSNPSVAWKFLQDKKDFIRDKYESGHIMSRLVKCSTENFASEEMAKEVEEFFKQNKFPGAERTVQQSLETIRLNADWLSRDGQSIEAFLSAYN